MRFIARDACCIDSVTASPEFKAALRCASEAVVVFTVCSWSDKTPESALKTQRETRAHLEPFLRGIPVHWMTRRDDRLARNGEVVVRVTVDIRESKEAQNADPQAALPIDRR